MCKLSFLFMKSFWPQVHKSAFYHISSPKLFLLFLGDATNVGFLGFFAPTAFEVSLLSSNGSIHQHRNSHNSPEKIHQNEYNIRTTDL